MKKQTKCPCGSCVTCACGVKPKMDEDGLCYFCGGVSYFIASLNGPPHLGTEEETENENYRQRIMEIIEKNNPNLTSKKEQLQTIKKLRNLARINYERLTDLAWNIENGESLFSSKKCKKLQTVVTRNISIDNEISKIIYLRSTLKKSK